jgi:type I restriction enzyme S subunit
MTTLGHAADMLVGFAFKSSGFLDADADGTPLLRGDNVQQGFIRWGDKTKKWSSADYQKLERYQLAEGDVILAMDRPIVGDGLKMAWIKPEDLPSLLVQRVCRLRGKPGVALTAFIRYVLANPDFSAHIHRITTGANIPHISGKDIAAYDFRLPNMEEQVKLVASLVAYDDLIATNQRRIALLEDAARRLYREWFVHLRFPGHELVPVKGDLPQGWLPSTFADLVEINPRTSFEKDVERPFVEMAALSETSMFIGQRGMRVIGGGAKFKNGDTLFARITPCAENGKTGFVQFLESGDAVASGSTEFIVMRSKKVNPWWVYCMSREENLRERAIRSMAGSDGRQRVNPKCFEQFAVLQPPRLVLEQFELAVADSFELVERLCEQNLQLARARNLLLPQLMSGQLDVSRIPLPDEVAA